MKEFTLLARFQAPTLPFKTANDKFLRRDCSCSMGMVLEVGAITGP